MKVLHIIPDLAYGNAARQLSLLAAMLEKSSVQCRVCVLSGIGPLAKPLAKLSVDFLGWNRWVDPRPFWRLHRVLAIFEPDVIHCWRQESVRALALVHWGIKGPVIVSSCSWARPSGGSWNMVDQWLLRRIKRLVVHWSTEMEHWKSLGISPKQIVQIPPGVGSFHSPESSPGNVDSPFPQEARLILCVGPLESSKGLKDAVWAFNMLGYLFPELRLVLIGEGADQKRLNRLARTLFPKRVVFLGSPSDYEEVLARAEVVWVPSLIPRGFNVALEAMAAGKPVVASSLPGLAEIVQSGETGVLVPPGDKAALARQTRVLLDDPARGRQLGEAGRHRAQEQFSLDSLTQAYKKLYESVVHSQLFGVGQCRSPFATADR